METIDARGLSCPEPVVLLQRAMKSNADAYELLVDNVAAKENATRFAEHQGYRVAATETDGEYRLAIAR